VDKGRFRRAGRIGLRRRAAPNHERQQSAATILTPITASVKVVGMAISGFRGTAMRTGAPVLATVLLFAGLCAAAEFKSDEAKNAVATHQYALKAAKIKYGEDLAAAKDALDHKKAAADNAIAREAFQKESELITQELVRLQQELKGGAAGEPKEFKTDAARKASATYGAAIQAAKKRYFQDLLAAQKTVLAKKGASTETAVKEAFQQELDLIAEEVKRLREEEKGATAVIAKEKVEADPGRLRAPSAGKTPGWIDLLAMADPAADSVQGSWERKGTSLAAAAASARGDRVLAFPVALKGSYELQVVLCRTAGDDVFGLVLPVGSSTVSFGLGWFGQRGSGFFPVDGKYPHESENRACVRPGPVQQNHEYTLHLKVVLRDDKAHISASMDGKPFVSWEGPQASLRAWNAWKNATDRVAVACRNADIVVSAARMRLISGQATPVRRESQP